MLDLAGVWTLSDESGQHSVSMALPGDGISALHSAGVIPDPYWGRNEYDCRWVSERDWVARRSFDHAGGAVDLVIEGLDTVAEVRLNGTPVLQAANVHRRFRVDVTGHLRRGANEIEIRFRSPVQAAAEQQAEMPFRIPYQEVNGPIPNANMLRKQQCDFGWDWNIALGQFGVSGKIALEPNGPRIADIIVTQTHRDGVAEVALAVHVDGVSDVTATLCGVTASAPVRAGVARMSLRIDTPQLWWPAGQGAQVLHDLTVTGGGASTTRRIGLRAMHLRSEPDAAGRSFGVEVNGRAVFARGANWIPADALNGRITVEGVRGLLQSAVDANMNMLRIWGGGRYEPDWFYDLCDEMGLMVWQDFMFACHLYPSTSEFLAEVDAEVRDVVARINHHACLAVWCGDNELIGALTWFPESRKDRDRYLVNYDRLNRTVEAALYSVLPGANWWPSSPSPGPLAFGDAWHDDSSGDMHFWSVWHEGRDFDHYRDVSPRFCSEFGFQSYPSMQTIRRFADPVDFNIAAPVMESHQKNPGGNARIAETMFRSFRFPVDFECFVYLSQVQQGIAIKTAVTHWRSLKPHCQGTLYWQLNDTWPVCSWASLDHGGNWKLLHHMARHFYAPVLVTAVPVEGAIELRAVNDTPGAATLEVTVNAIAMSGKIRPLGQHLAEVLPDSAVVVATLPAGTLAEDEILAFLWGPPGAPDQGDIHAPKPWKAYDLPATTLTQTAKRSDTGWQITVETDAPAFFVALEADQPGRFSNNAFALFPGYPATVTFTPDTPGQAPRFTLRDLRAATYGQT
ncbi:MAG: glycoside hydrolase family 2 protein [Tabrizicola sp.]|uniref:beta-mannosidase n=1 Tax=Tabrizicola sp. TaxID=2005166 RepID=UPI002732BB48|nr:glycoside hydrolase family 2 protein [Tabrizicola sp.]MDP3263898.1 glycoside hydrolase family 2 protein [Tabrizicola sp.]MDP3647262.1 glycoside hydrolase family 2 protein [Paracoccaceae bacterium]MDZ4068597.1 glycoside hydrolase family 2 protein [Tabrizicola sp.]